MTSTRSFAPQRMLFIACVAQNVATGLTFGSIGLLIEPVSTQLQGGRGVLSLAIALVLAMMGLLSPLVGRWVDRWSLRGTMLLGAGLSALGFFLTARATSTGTFLVYFGGLVGIGFALVGVLPANKIVALWFPGSVGRAGAVVNMPLGIAVLPPCFAWLLRDFGWRHLLDLFAATHVLLFLLLLQVRKPAQSVALVNTDAEVSGTEPFRTRPFWWISGIAGLLTTSGIVSSTHIVPFAQSMAIVDTRAALLLSISGIFSVIGAAFYGWLCDRRTPLFALALIAASNTVLWLLLTLQREFLPIAAIVAALGLGGGGLMPVLAALLGRVFSAERFGSAFGQLNLATLPFTFAAAPVVGFVYDRFGSYSGAFVLEMSLCFVSLLLLLVAGRLMRIAKE